MSVCENRSYFKFNVGIAVANFMYIQTTMDPLFIPGPLTFALFKTGSTGWVGHQVNIPIDLWLLSHTQR